MDQFVRQERLQVGGLFSGDYRRRHQYRRAQQANNRWTDRIVYDTDRHGPAKA
jgi:hypothetical protein